MTKPGVARPVVIPMYQVSVPIILSNLRTAQVPREQFLSWLDNQ